MTCFARWMLPGPFRSRLVRRWRFDAAIPGVCEPPIFMPWNSREQGHETIRPLVFFPAHRDRSAIHRDRIMVQRDNPRLANSRVVHGEAPGSSCGSGNVLQAPDQLALARLTGTLARRLQGRSLPPYRSRARESPGRRKGQLSGVISPSPCPVAVPSRSARQRACESCPSSFWPAPNRERPHAAPLVAPEGRPPRRTSCAAAGSPPAS